MARRLRIFHVLWCLWPIVLSLALQRGLRQLFPGAPWVERRRQRVHERNAERLARACLRLRGVYIKLGQLLSVMGTFLPSCYVKSLERLQDAVPPRPWRVIRRSLTKALDAPPEELFQSIATRPVAAGSIAQVHEATLHDGTHVAVKVRYPGIAAILALDLHVLAFGLRVARRFAPVSQARRVLSQLEDLLARESDLMHEARCIRQMRELVHDDPDVVIPAVVEELSGPSVLTMTFVEGVKITDRAALEALGLRAADVAKKLVEVFFRSVFRDGFFHADPHPGNLLVQRGDAGQVRLVMLDLGSASTLRPNLGEGLWAVMEGLLRKDEKRFLDGVDTMGFVAADGDRELLVRTLRSYFGRILTLDIADFSNIADSEADKMDIGLSREDTNKLVQAIEYPLGWYYLERSIMLIFGVVSRIAPKLNLVQVGVPFVLPYMLARRRRAA